MLLGMIHLMDQRILFFADVRIEYLWVWKRETSYHQERDIYIYIYTFLFVCTRKAFFFSPFFKLDEGSGHIR